ncbi:DNA polymerase zeta [Lambiella insularis]|nr:DNA polymerase zeta [Lambiella insularis]
MDIFRVRLNCVDYYQTAPIEFDPQLRQSDEEAPQNPTLKVPVIRVFGATPTGQKVCAHIHGVFPYLYIAYSGGLEPDAVDDYIHRLHLSIDHALTVSYRRQTFQGKTSFVAHITLVKGIPFYGYHVGYYYFLKIYLLHPLYMSRLADLLRQGAIMKNPIQPYESHMQYILQWMCDFNLYGCAYIECSKAKFRSPIPDYLELKSTIHHWHNRTIPESLVSDEEQLPRQSHCSIEVDVCAHDIINRLEAKGRLLHHDFTERSNLQAPDEKLVHSMAGLWRDETRRRQARMGNLDSGISPFPPEVLVSVSADPRNTQNGDWIHSKEYLEKLHMIMCYERGQSDGRPINPATIVQLERGEDGIKTAFESIEDLFPVNLSELYVARRARSGRLRSVRAFEDDDIEVDESRICASDQGDSLYDTDEDAARDMETTSSQEDEQTSVDNDHDRGPYTTNGSNMQKIDAADRPFLVDGVPKKAKGPSGPTGSVELEILGIRDARNNDQNEQDSFEIPSKCRGNINSALVGRKRVVLHATVSRRPRKRQRIIHSGEPSSQEMPYDTASAQPVVKLVDVSARAVEDERSDPCSSPTSESGGHSSDQQIAKPASVLEQATELSRNLGVMNTIDVHGKISRLLNPGVKDSHGAHTAQTLSQQRNYNTKSSRGSISKHVSFDPSLKLTLDKDDHGLEHPFKLITNSSPEHASHILTMISKVHDTFDIPASRRIYALLGSAPALIEVGKMEQVAGISHIIYQDAHYADDSDVPERPREYAGKEYKLLNTTIPYQPNFDETGTSVPSMGGMVGGFINRDAEKQAYQRLRRACTIRSWEISNSSPGRLEVEQWLNSDVHLRDHIARRRQSKSLLDLSQVDGPTQKNGRGYKYSQKQASTSIQHETQYMSLMSLEIHVNTRGSMVPNPEQDKISCVFWCLQPDVGVLEVNTAHESTHVGILVLSESGDLGHKISQQTSVKVEEERTELDLINHIIDIVRNYDPDILTGFEVHGGSWGYMIERARLKYDYHLCDELSRMKSLSHGRFGRENDKWGFNQTSTIRITGRHVINIWRAMRGELNLLQYTLENIVFHILHRRIPHYAFSDLTTWYNSSAPKDLGKVIDYFVSRVQLDLEILEQNELIPRTSEQARLLGVDFFSVFSRGSQFKVESLMFRIAKPENFILISPSRKQVGRQNALECLPLVMEPQSAFYNSPLLVLDFQSLYPSVIIAYNYCYSTFLGRVVDWRGQNKMGFTDLKREAGLLELLKDHINIAPNGMMFVKHQTRKSLLAKMLGEILETRVMVKSGMKLDKDDKALQRLLNNRQLALKLIANVTYGYTSASFSGRMPCSEIADSIVQTGRETLEKTIALIHSVKKWSAEVVYGDTDSLFVYLEGRTKDEAFDIGNEIAKTITDMNPRPVKLKFEKVYLPSILLAKKRYVGFKYESKAQKEPEFDAKGIETVRRDGTPAEQKLEEKALKILFRTADLSQVKRYFQDQCTKIMKGKISIQDFCFAKEVKLGTYSDKGLPPPGALISTRRMLEDPRAEPQYGERVPYVVITGAPGARLIDRCVAPEVLLLNDQNELDAEYYIAKNLIPPLERIFNLVGANVRQWYDEMPKYQRVRRIEGPIPFEDKDLSLSKTTLESYMKSSACLVCRKTLEEEFPICSECIKYPEASLSKLRSNVNNAETKAVNIEKICRSCSALAWGEDVKCDSKDCPVFYTRTRHISSLSSMRMVTQPAMAFLQLEDGLMVDCYASSQNTIQREHDDDKAFASGSAALTKNFSGGQELDVAEGFFAVCREYVPGGVNGKPPERTTPAGEVIAEESPSVYQSMYRSFFERKQGPALESNKGNGKSARKARNVFYIVLRHGHLMLYDDSEQGEVRHVISLAHHEVSIYSGGNEIPEGELWIKRNAIRLARKESAENVTLSSKPFFLFSDNCSDKEDFYFALVRNQERHPSEQASPPRPQYFEVKDIISLVQRLHSSEEHLQTRWINAIVGRLFLAVYKTQDIEDFVRMKITEKIARVRKPAFLSGIILQRIDLGEAAPQVTNPHLKDLTIDGDCCVEADFKYAGNFKLEIAATARIDLGTRFKAREVHLVLAAVVKRLEGHVLLRFKPPPSNRVWISFESMPQIEMAIEPVVSSRQITYGVIIRAIESRIREVIAETIVLPHWDDSPFLNTVQQRFRGGLWADERNHLRSASHQISLPDEDADHEAEADPVSGSDSPELKPIKDDRSLSMPSLVDDGSISVARKRHKSNISTASIESASSMDPQKRSEPPRAIRSRSFASAADPIVSIDHANVEAANNDGNSKVAKDAARIMTEISRRSQPNSPVQTPMESMTSRPTTFLNKRKTGSVSPASSSKSSVQDTSVSQTVLMNNSGFLTPVLPAFISSEDKTLTNEPETQRAPSTKLLPQSLDIEKRQPFPAISAAAAVVKKWGWNAITRNAQQGESMILMSEDGRQGTPARPIGPGQPLPRPDKRKSTPVAIPKRKALPTPLLPARIEQHLAGNQNAAPTLPKRQDNFQNRGEVLVVKAPSNSESISALDDNFGEYIYNVNEEEGKDLVTSSARGILPTNTSGTLTTSESASSHLPLHDEDGSSDLPSRRAVWEKEA